MLGIFIKFAQFDSKDDLFFSRVECKRMKGSLKDPLVADKGVGRKKYRQKDVNDLIKECAICHNLDPKKFSTKSFKNGGITSVKINSSMLGIDEQELANQFDHKTISSNRKYQRLTITENIEKGPSRFIDKRMAYSHKNLELLASVNK